MTTVYTLPNCVQCDMTKKLMEREGIAYETVDLSTNDEAMEHVRSLGYQSAPVVISGNQHWSGFKVERIKGLKRP